MVSALPARGANWEQWGGEVHADLNGRLSASALSTLGIAVAGLTGVGDETAKIQAVMDSASTFGASVILPPGVFNVSGLIMRSQNMKLSGAGTTLRASSATPGYIIRTSSFSTIRDLKFELAGLDVVGISVYSTSRLLVENIYIQSNTQSVGTGIKFHGAASNQSAHANRLTNIMIMNVGVGVHGESWCYDNEMLNIWVGTCGEGIRMSSGSHLLTNIHVWGCTGDGLEFYGANGGDSRVVNAYLETNGGYGLRANNLTNGNSYIGIRFWRNKAGGSYVIGGHGSRFIGCWADENTGVAYDFADHSYAMMSSCQAYDNREIKTQTLGIRTQGTSDYLTMTGCVMTTQRHSIGSQSIVGAHNYVEGNIFSDTNTSFNVGFPTKQGPSGVTVSSAAGFDRAVTFNSGTTSRWVLRANTAAEGGGNAGSDFELVARADAGEYLSTPFSVVRSTGRVSFSYPVRVPALATTERPSSVSVGAGAHMFDTTLGRPIWSDGKIWVDAAGVAV